MFAMTMSSDENSLYSCTDDQKITVWNIETYEIIHVITLNEGKIRAILLTPDDKYLIAGDEAFRITIWNSNDCSLKTVIRSHRESIWSFALLGHDILFSGDQDGVILRHNLTTFKLEDELEGEKSCIQSLCISRDNEFLISGYSSGLMWV